MSKDLFLNHSSFPNTVERTNLFLVLNKAERSLFQTLLFWEMVRLQQLNEKSAFLGNS